MKSVESEDADSACLSVVGDSHRQFDYHALPETISSAEKMWSVVKNAQNQIVVLLHCSCWFRCRHGDPQARRSTLHLCTVTTLSVSC